MKVLLDRFGATSAEQAGIQLADKPSPLYQLLMLSTLLSARISGDIAVATAKELFAAGYRTPQRMRAATWQDRVDALCRGGYRRYDERTSTILDDSAALLLDRWHGDLRRMREDAGGDPKRIRELLTEFKGMGPVGADIFLREVQAVWPQVAPYRADANRRARRRAAPLPLSRGVTHDQVRCSAAGGRFTLGDSGIRCPMVSVGYALSCEEFGPRELARLAEQEDR